MHFFFYNNATTSEQKKPMNFTSYNNKRTAKKAVGNYYLFAKYASYIFQYFKFYDIKIVYLLF